MAGMRLKLKQVAEQPVPPSEVMYRPKDIAIMLGCSLGTAMKILQGGAGVPLPHVKLEGDVRGIFIRKADWEAWLETMIRGRGNR